MWFGQLEPGEPVSATTVDPATWTAWEAYHQALQANQQPTRTPTIERLSALHGLFVACQIDPDSARCADLMAQAQFRDQFPLAAGWTPGSRADLATGELQQADGTTWHLENGQPVAGAVPVPDAAPGVPGGAPGVWPWWVWPAVAAGIVVVAAAAWRR